MQVLYDHGFPVPRPVDVNRNCIVMELLEATTLCNVTELDRYGWLEWGEASP